MAGLENVRLAAFDEVDSTNAEAERRAKAGERGPLWILAGRQTAGRGRLGRAWDSGLGNLHSTLLVTLPVTAEIAAQTSFVAALAVFDTAAQVLCDASRLALKWPNDVLLDGGKLSGILIETVAHDRPDLTTLAIGIGLNLAYAPALSRYRATSLAEHGAMAEPQAALEVLAAALDRRLAAWNNGSNFAVVRHDWMARAAGLGGPVAVTEAGRTVTGQFRGLAADGALLLAEPDGQLRAVHAGDVSLAFGTGKGLPAKIE